MPDYGHDLQFGIFPSPDGDSRRTHPRARPGWPRSAGGSTFVSVQDHPYQDDATSTPGRCCPSSRRATTADQGSHPTWPTSRCARRWSWRVVRPPRPAQTPGRVGARPGSRRVLGRRSSRQAAPRGTPNESGRRTRRGHRRHPPGSGPGATPCTGRWRALPGHGPARRTRPRPTTSRSGSAPTSRGCSASRPTSRTRGSRRWGTPSPHQARRHEREAGREHAETNGRGPQAIRRMYNVFGGGPSAPAPASSRAPRATGPSSWPGSRSTRGSAPSSSAPTMRTRSAGSRSRSRRPSASRSGGGEALPPGGSAGATRRTAPRSEPEGERVTITPDTAPVTAGARRRAAVGRVHPPPLPRARGRRRRTPRRQQAYPRGHLIDIHDALRAELTQLRDVVDQVRSRGLGCRWVRRGR